jgi:hypothetical protein
LSKWTPQARQVVHLCRRKSSLETEVILPLFTFYRDQGEMFYRSLERKRGGVSKSMGVGLAGV